MQVFNLDQIQKNIDLQKIIKGQEEGFVAYSKGIANIPMPGYIRHDHPDSSYHIKYGHIDGDPIWVVKIAGGPEHLPINGIMIAISTSTGQPKYILQDQGYLTAYRTAVAGLICAKYLARKQINAIGVLGTGVQSRMQVKLLKHVTKCKKLYVWGRSKEKLIEYQKEMRGEGFEVVVTLNPSEISKNCHLIITTTPSEHPILMARDLLPGTHITAIGADSPGKIEMDPKIFKKMDVIVLDSRKQCYDHGEIAQAYRKGYVEESNVLELGELINNPSQGRQNEDQITIADLTGLAVQDIQIAKSVIESLDIIESI